MQSGAADRALPLPHPPGTPEENPPPPRDGQALAAIGARLGGIFGTSRPRGRRLSPGQLVAREVTRSVPNKVAGQIAADIGKSLGGKTGSSVGRAIVRGTMGGILRR